MYSRSCVCVLCCVLCVCNVQAGSTWKVEHPCPASTAVQHSAGTAHHYVNANCSVMLINPGGC